MAHSTTKKINVGALIQLIGRDEDGTGFYQWRLTDENGHWSGEPQRGDINDLVAAIPRSQTDVALVLAGTEVVAQTLPYEAVERKHLRKLLPFELEETVAQELDDFHFALGPINDSDAVIAYVDNEWLTAQIDELESNGLDVIHCFSYPHLLPRSETGWALRLDDMLHVHYGDGLGFSVESGLGEAVLRSLPFNDESPAELLLIAEDEGRMSQLLAMVPIEILSRLDESNVDRHLASSWDSLSLNQTPALELRQGPLSRQLPYNKWWKDWQSVSILAAVTLLVYVAVNLGSIVINDNRRKAVLQQRVDVYHEVAQGNAPDPEKQLQQKLSQYQSSSSGSNVMAMYAKIAPLIASNSSIEMRSIRYANQTGDMQLTLDAKTYDDVIKLSENINKAGLQSRLQNTSQQGDMQQARMVVSGGGL